MVYNNCHVIQNVVEASKLVRQAVSRADARNRVSALVRLGAKDAGATREFL